MHSLAPLSPLGQRGPHTDRVGSITITEVTDLALASVSCRMGRQPGFAKVARTLFDISLPGPGKWTAGPVYSLIWTGPDQWFAQAPFATHEDIAARIKDALGSEASVTEQSDGWARFRLTGTAAVPVLQRLCAVDSAAMQTGDATRTMIEHLGSLVVCYETGTTFDILCPRSGAGSMHHALTAAAQSVA